MAHFTLDELKCRHCGEMRYTDAALDHLETLRVCYGKPMILSSAYRCPDHNALVSRTGRTGPHTVSASDNVAVDVLIHGRDAWDLLRHAFALPGWTGVGIQQKGPVGRRFVHLDRVPNSSIHPRPWPWSY